MSDRDFKVTILTALVVVYIFSSIQTNPFKIFMQIVSGFGSDVSGGGAYYGGYGTHK